MLKKRSSEELLYQMGQYLVWSIHSTRRFKFVPRVTNGYAL